MKKATWLTVILLGILLTRATTTDDEEDGEASPPHTSEELNSHIAQLQTPTSYIDTDFRNELPTRTSDTDIILDNSSQDIVELPPMNITPTKRPKGRPPGTGKKQRKLLSFQQSCALAHMVGGTPDDPNYEPDTPNSRTNRRIQKRTARAFFPIYLRIIIPFVRLSVCPYDCLSVCPFARMTVYLFVRLPVCRFVRLPV